jgi:hypothetical protein
MKKIWMVLLMALTAMAQQDTRPEKTEKPPKQVVQKLFILKYADPEQLRQLLTVFDASVRQSPELHALTVEATPEAMHAIEDAVQKLDVPSATPKNVEMTLFLLVATDSATAAGSSIPKDVDSVVTQLKNTFPFKNYGLLDVLTFRTRTGQQVRTTSSGGSLQMGNRQVSVITQLMINSIALQSDGNTLRIERLNAQFKVPQMTGVFGGGNDVQFSYIDLQMQTDLDVKEGQKVVVGRLGLSHDQALFLVMMGKVL